MSTFKTRHPNRARWCFIDRNAHKNIKDGAFTVRQAYHHCTTLTSLPFSEMLLPCTADNLLFCCVHSLRVHVMAEMDNEEAWEAKTHKHKRRSQKSNPAIRYSAARSRGAGGSIFRVYPSSTKLQCPWAIKAIFYSRWGPASLSLHYSGNPLY